MTDHSETSYDVAIIGYGPTGATLAHLLVLCGLKVLVLEREAGIYNLPRAVHLDDEVMRVFQTIGVADALKDIMRINVGMRFVGPDGTLLLDWPRPQEVGPHGWHASYRFHQPDLERLLRDTLEAQELVTARTSAELFLVRDLGQRVELRFEDLTTGRLETAYAKYAVGCDGARSLTRRFISSEMEDLGFQERWLVVDAMLKHDMPELGDHSIQFCDPVRPMTYCRSPENRRRWEITVLDEEETHEITRPERVWELLQRWITPQDADLERAVVYTFRSAIARKWRLGRVLIAGDAAHLTPPFMGQGMCAGIRDVSNLAWKIALCTGGKAQDALLDTYQSERSPHVRAYITTAMRLGGLINSLDPAGGLELANDQTGGQATMASIAPALGGGLGKIFDCGRAEHRGRLFVQPTLSNAMLMDDACGYRPVLVSRQPLQRKQDAGRPDGPVLLDAQAEPSLAAILDDLETNAVLVRPDRYILASAVSDDEIQSLLGCGLPSPLQISETESESAA